MRPLDRIGMKYTTCPKSLMWVARNRVSCLHSTIVLIAAASLPGSCGGVTRTESNSTGGAGHGGDTGVGNPVTDAGTGGSNVDAGDTGTGNCPNSYTFGDQGRCEAYLEFSARARDSNNCSFPLPAAPASLSGLYITINCALVAQQAGDAGNSWSIDFTSTPVRLVFAGLPCDLLNQEANTEVDIYQYSFCL